MDHLQKFLRKIAAKTRTQLRRVMAALAEGNLHNLDIKPLQGKKGWFRCRVGDIRILFFRTKGGKTVVYDMNFRGTIYR